ncbi:MAG: response regulator [Proteobacteria bacterium]|nr:response regulator [Pseudomonadota bacterium]
MSEMKKILWVDDDDTILDAFKLKLEKTGRFEIVITTDGSRVVALAQEIGPDLIVTDIKMPFVDGADVANLLKKTDATKSIPLLFLSSLVTKEEMDATGGFIGGRHMASKSTSVEKIIAKIDSMLNAEK